MLNFFKDREVLLKEKTLKAIASSGSRTASEGIIKSVAILTTDEISHEHNLQGLVEKALKVRNSRIYSYRKFNKDNVSSYKHFSEKDISRNGKILDVSFDSFIEHPFDLLITILDTNNLYLEFATAISNAQYKVGFANVNPNLFNLEIIADASNVEEFLAEVNRYLIILNKLPKQEN